VASNRSLLFDFIPSSSSIPAFAQAMLDFFGSEMSAEMFWNGQEAWFPNSGAAQIFYAYLYYTFTDYNNLEQMLINMNMYSSSEADAPGFPLAFRLLYQIFDTSSEAQDFIDKKDYYGQTAEDVAQMPEFYNKNKPFMATVAPDIFIVGVERYYTNAVGYVAPPVELVAAQTPV
jgi:hypothetical protein